MAPPDVSPARPWRTHLVAEVSAATDSTDSPGDQEVVVCGWITQRRVLRTRAFLQVRDRSGTLQVLCTPAQAATVESCVRIRGTVQHAPDPTGAPRVELAASEVQVLNRADALPWRAGEAGSLHREAAFRYRYLSMRHPQVRRLLDLRGRLTPLLVRELDERGFTTLETPYLAHHSSGGAREFVITSSQRDDVSYWLPQSSQVFRSLIMTGGVERYFQMTKNFRDEWHRGTHQPEFAILDTECAFTTPNQLRSLIEEVISRSTAELTGARIPTPFAVIDDADERRSTPHELARLGFRWTLRHPLFVREADRWLTYHQPFDAPLDPDQRDLGDDPGAIVSSYWTLRHGGLEIGGGSARIFDPGLLNQALDLIGQGGTNVRLLEAMRFGTPPHTGFALSLDALAMILLDTPNIRSVTAFPKSGSGRCYLFGDVMDEEAVPLI